MKKQKIISIPKYTTTKPRFTSNPSPNQKSQAPAFQSIKLNLTDTPQHHISKTASPPPFQQTSTLIDKNVIKQKTREPQTDQNLTPNKQHRNGEKDPTFDEETGHKTHKPNDANQIRTLNRRRPPSPSPPFPPPFPGFLSFPLPSNLPAIFFNRQLRDPRPLEL